MDPQERNIEVAILQLQIQCISLLLKFLKMSLTGKSFSEALIFASTNPQYDKKLKIASSEHVVFINCSECQNKDKKQRFTCTRYAPVSKISSVYAH